MTDETREDEERELHSIPIEDETGESKEEGRTDRATDQDEMSDSEIESEDRRRWKQRLKERREALTGIWAEDKRASTIDEIRKLEKAGIREGYMTEDDRGSYEITPGDSSDSQVNDGDSTGQNDQTEGETQEAVDDESSRAHEVDTDRKNSQESSDIDSPGGKPRKRDESDSTNRSDTEGGMGSDAEPSTETNTDVEAVSPPSGSPKQAGAGEADGDEEATKNEADASSSGTSDEDSDETSESATGMFVDATGSVDDSAKSESGQSSGDTESPETVEPSDQAVSRDEFEALQEDLTDLQETVNNLDQWFSEYKRRNEREHEEIRQYSIEEFAGNMLRVRDTLQRAIELNDWSKSDEKAIQSTLKMFDQQFTSDAIDPIDPERGESFDSGRHEMVARKPAPDLDKNSVVRVKKKGFLLLDRVIRPAQVVVAQPE